ncbi:hypothetical protein, partial [Acinetobacter variabilis]|uniref:hypothetical protein n=1 Tax=Acinetobacter variabilis TaxID=70346 RepID=UPI0030FC6FC5
AGGEALVRADPRRETPLARAERAGARRCVRAVPATASRAVVAAATAVPAGTAPEEAAARRPVPVPAGRFAPRLRGGVFAVVLFAAAVFVA